MVRLILAAIMMCGVMTAPAQAQDAVEVSATCMDARGAPHPAAQTFAEREPPAAFEGELFRCLAGTHLRYDVDRRVSDCAPGEALWLGGGALSCRAAAEHAREHDRGLLRQFGAGVKQVRLAAPAPAQESPEPQRRWRY